jgi:hypothetical protein
VTGQDGRRAGIGGLVVNMSRQYPQYTDSEKASRNVGA